MRTFVPQRRQRAAAGPGRRRRAPTAPELSMGATRAGTWPRKRPPPVRPSGLTPGSDRSDCAGQRVAGRKTQPRRRCGARRDRAGAPVSGQGALRGNSASPAVLRPRRTARGAGGGWARPGPLPLCSGPAGPARTAGRGALPPPRRPSPRRAKAGGGPAAAARGGAGLSPWLLSARFGACRGFLAPLPRASLADPGSQPTKRLGPAEPPARAIDPNEGRPPASAQPARARGALHAARHAARTRPPAAPPCRPGPLRPLACACRNGGALAHPARRGAQPHAAATGASGRAGCDHHASSPARPYRGSHRAAG